MLAGLSGAALIVLLRSGVLTRLTPASTCFDHNVLRSEGRWLAAQWACGQRQRCRTRQRGVSSDVREDPTLRSTSARRHRSDRGQGWWSNRSAIWPRRHLPPFTRCSNRWSRERSSILPIRSRGASFVQPPTTSPNCICQGEGGPRPARRGRRGARGSSQRLIQADDAHTKSEFERRSWGSSNNTPSPARTTRTFESPQHGRRRVLVATCRCRLDGPCLP